MSEPTNSWTCGACGATCERYRGQGDIQCRCGAQYNGFGQRLRDDWRNNASNWDDEVSDMDGYENQFAGDA